MGVNIQSSGNFQKLVGLYEVPLIEYWQDKFADAMKDSMIPEFFTKRQSNNPSEAISELVGAPQFKGWKGEFTYAELKEGNTKVMTPIVWEAGLAFDRFLLSNAKLADLKMQVSQGKFALAAARLRNYAMMGIFTYADKPSFTINGETLNWTLTADGQPLASNAHVGANYSVPQSNLLAGELNEGNLEIACQTMMEFKDEDGNDANLEPDTLVVPPRLRQVGLELIGGAGKYDRADNNPNIYYGSMRLIVVKQLQKQSGKTGYPWFVVDIKAAKEVSFIINRLESGDDFEINSWKDDETQTWKLGSLMWFVGAVVDWRPYVFSIPA